MKMASRITRRKPRFFEKPGMGIAPPALARAGTFARHDLKAGPETQRANFRIKLQAGKIAVLTIDSNIRDSSQFMFLNGFLRHRLI